jgi:hypothetical protein
MTDAPPKNSLAGRFEALRTREHELITRLLDVLPRIDGLEAELIGQTRAVPCRHAISGGADGAVQRRQE